MRAKNLSEQSKRRWMYNVLCLEKPKKEQEEYSIFYKQCLSNRYQTQINRQINRHWWNWGKNLSMIVDLMAVFFPLIVSWNLPSGGNFIPWLFLWRYVLTCGNVQLVFLFARFFSLRNSSVWIIALWTWYVTYEFAV